MAYLLAMLGNTFKLANDYENALSYFNKAIKWHNERHQSVSTYAYCLLSVSEMMLNEKKNTKAVSRMTIQRSPMT